MEVSNQVLPPFRQDLQLYQGPDEPDGTKTFKVFDPIKAQYYKISWAESLIIKFHRPGMSVEKLCNEINTRSTLKVTPPEVFGFFQQAIHHNLLSYPKGSDRLNKEYEHSRPNPFMWLIFHYLYIRITLWNPSSFLRKTLPYARLFASPFAFWVYGILSFIGIFLTFTKLDQFIYHLPSFFNFEGIILYAIALTGVKFIHEFGHAYTAEHFGVQVRSAGVALLVLWPVLFTDVTDAWKLLRSRDRLLISAAGIIVETVIAGLCTFGWAISPPGMISNLFFVIASISWFSTILVNANPAMRFDGYYILSDFWGVDNLQSRAFEVTRWKLRQWLLGISLPPPDRNLSPERIRGMIIYSLFTWFYRLILYTGIALFVYFTFTKALGIILFLVEIGIFLLWPIVSELVTLFKMRREIKGKKRIGVGSLILTAVLIWLAIPLNRHERFSAITVPAEEQTIYIPYHSKIVKIFVKRGQEMQPGDLIMRLESVELEAELKKLQIEESLLKQNLKVISYDDKNRPLMHQQMKELQAVHAKLESVRARKADLTLRAEHEGVLYDWDENLKEGQSVTKDQMVGKIANTLQPELIIFIPEDHAKDVSPGKKVEFVPALGTGKYQGEVERINPVRASKLLYPSLASIYHGSLQVTQDGDGQLHLVDTYYPATVKLEGMNGKVRFGQTGTVHLQGEKHSLLVDGIKKLSRIFWRESGGF